MMRRAFPPPPSRFVAFFSLGIGALALAGCATNPKASLPAVRDAVADRGGLTVAWVQTDDDKVDADRAVAALLRQELTPDRAVEIAVLNNRELRATFEDLGVSQADLIAAGRLRNPSLGLSVRWPAGPGGPDVEASFMADLFDAVLMPVRKKVAREQLAQAEWRVAHAVLALAAEVKIAAYQVQAREELRARFAAIVAVNDAAADLARRQADAGDISELDLASQQVVAQESQLQLIKVDALLRADRERLNRLLGLSDGQIGWTMAARLPPLPKVDALPENLEDLAVARRLDVAALKSRADVAARALALREKTRLLPASFDLGVDTERQPGEPRVTGPRVEIGLPVFDQGQADLARLGAEARRATANYEGLVADVRSRVREGRDALAAARAAAEFCRDTLLPQRRLLLRETLLHYNAMQKSGYDLLAARESELAAEREGIESLRDYWIARATLEMAAGGRLAAVEKASTLKPRDAATNAETSATPASAANTTNAAAARPEKSMPSPSL